MKTKLTSIAATFIFMCLSFNASARDNGGGEHYVFNLIGTGYMYEGFEDLDGDGIADDPAICFDVNLIDAKNQQVIGTGTDCLSNVTPTGTGLALIGTTYFRTPYGDLVVRGNTSVQPVFQSTVSSNGQVMTHITGAAGTENAVIDGTSRFEGATGTARLSGMVDLSGFGGNVGDPIAFNCLFVVDLY
jgi:hypothetical protein